MNRLLLVVSFVMVGLLIMGCGTTTDKTPSEEGMDQLSDLSDQELEQVVEGGDQSAAIAGKAVYASDTLRDAAKDLLLERRDQKIAYLTQKLALLEAQGQSDANGDLADEILPKELQAPGVCTSSDVTSQIKAPFECINHKKCQAALEVEGSAWGLLNGSTSETETVYCIKQQCITDEIDGKLYYGPMMQYFCKVKKG